jgi:signal transduction histidine kinase
MAFGWLRLHGERLGLVSLEAGVGLMAGVSLASAVAVILLTAVALDRADIARGQAEESLAATEAKRARLEAQLAQAEKLNALGRLAGGVAHDFNNLLTVMGSCATFASDAIPDDHPARKDIDEIRHTVARSARLTKQLLAFGRQKPSQRVVLDLNAVLRDTNALLGRVIGEGIELTSSLSEDLWRVSVDPGEIEQIVVNLVVNARDAMPKGGSLTIETKNVELDAEYASEHAEVVPGRYVQLSVIDSGLGMPPEVQAKIFEPFFSTKGEKGTGLGLATVYGIVRQSGGHVWVYSEPGLGTTIKIYLPRVDGDVANAAPTVATHVVVAPGDVVLLVDDDDKVRAAVVRMLERIGYRVIAAAGPEEALAIDVATLSGVAVLLTDMVMPGMSGREVAEKLRSMSPTLRVI